MQQVGALTYAAARKRGPDLLAKFKDRIQRRWSAWNATSKSGHRPARIRTTNRLERSKGESRRRTEVIPRFPTECSCLSLLYASSITASKHWRGSR
jgi:transposase-like protein